MNEYVDYFIRTNVKGIRNDYECHPNASCLTKCKSMSCLLTDSITADERKKHGNSDEIFMTDCSTRMQPTSALQKKAETGKRVLRSLHQFLIGCADAFFSGGDPVSIAVS